MKRSFQRTNPATVTRVNRCGTRFVRGDGGTASMRGKMPVLATVVAGVVGVTAGGWPVVRGGLPEGGTQSSMKAELSSVLADQEWAKPKPGSWTPPKAAPDGLPPVINSIQTQEKVVF